VLSDDGLCQKQLFSELRLGWKDIAEWRYIRVQDVEGFWILDRTGKRHDLKHWLVFGKQRSKQVAEVLRQMGVVGREEYDAQQIARLCENSGAARVAGGEKV
jgi:hypothetical protein